jgi:putative restriction endonuclease
MEVSRFVGVDLAWGARNRTGLAVVDESGHLLDMAERHTDDDIVEWLRPHTAEPCLVAIDAPLIVANPTGRRPCEAQLNAVFGRYDAGAHPSNTAKPWFTDGPRGARLAQRLGLDIDPDSTQHRRALEVYPHPAMIVFFDLNRTIKYKHKPGRSLDELRGASATLVALLESLETAEPSLVLRGSAWDDVRRTVGNATRKSQLRSVEDRLDAVLCAYIALFSARHPERMTTFGDGDTGYIATPTLPPNHRPPAQREVRAQATGRADETRVLEMFSSLRQHQHEGKRSPHKPLLVLTALGRLVSTGESTTPFSEVEAQLASLISTYGPPSRTSAASSAAYPFTRLRSDNVWQLSADVAMDNVGPLREHDVSGRFTPEVEAALRSSPELVSRLARMLVESQFPETLAPEILLQAGLDSEAVLGAPTTLTRPSDVRRRSIAWVQQILTAWDRMCAFCGYDGQLGDSVAGIEAAHVRWFNLGGPDDPDNGLALCSLHHKLFDRGALGLDERNRVKVSGLFVGRTPAAQIVYELHGAELEPRLGTVLPSAQYVAWHNREVFKGQPLLA